MSHRASTPISSPERQQNVALAHGKEVEVKLSCPAHLLESIPRLDALSGTKWKSRPQRLAATYFDTQKDALDRAGMSLRLRQTGAKRIMTLKWALEAENAFSRGESEVVSPNEEPALDLFDPDIAARIMAATQGDDLTPRFQTKVRRRIGELDFGETVIEIAIDEGEISAGDRRVPIAECELELKGGDPADLYRVAGKLTEAGLILSPAQKSQRGYRLARNEKPAEQRAVHTKLEPMSSIEDAMSSIIEEALRQFVGNWPALLEADCPESVHQMRVALRRLRAGLSQFEKELPNAGFRNFRQIAKSLANELGAARDLDVLIALIVDGPLACFPDEPSFAPLLSNLSERRQEMYLRAREAISTPHASRFVLELQTFVSSRGWRNRPNAEELPKLGAPAKDVAREILDRLYRRTRKLGKDISVANTEERHELRIALKNLRYCADFFGSLYDTKTVTKFSRLASAFQDALGAHNDAASAYDMIKRAALMTSHSRAEGIVAGWCAREITSPDLHLEDHWISFKKARCFWQE